MDYENWKTLLVGLDDLLGGEQVVDSWTSNEPYPEIHQDFKNSTKNYQFESVKAFNQFVEKQRLFERADEIKKQLNDEAPDGAYQRNLIESLDGILRAKHALENGLEPPSYEELFTLATAGLVGPPKRQDPSEAREHLIKQLEKVGYHATEKNLRETYLKWAQDKVVAPEEVANKVGGIIDTLFGFMKSNVFSKMDLSPIEGDLHLNAPECFNACEFTIDREMEASGFMAYKGGKDELGNHLFKAFYRHNSRYVITLPSLYHLCAHEVVGHYLNACMLDLLSSQGKLGFLSTIATMHTPESAFQEGWAQNSFEICFNTREEAAETLKIGNDLLVALAVDDLQDYAKYNASVIYQQEGGTSETVAQHVRDDCVQSDSIVTKMSGMFAKGKIFGPMYGPAYLVGKTIFNKSLFKNREKAIRVGYGLEGPVDLTTIANL